jgi:hypothetical protein
VNTIKLVPDAPSKSVASDTDQLPPDTAKAPPSVAVPLPPDSGEPAHVVLANARARTVKLTAPIGVVVGPEAVVVRVSVVAQSAFVLTRQVWPSAKLGSTPDGKAVVMSKSTPTAVELPPMFTLIA